MAAELPFSCGPGPFGARFVTLFPDALAGSDLALTLEGTLEGCARSILGDDANPGGAALIVKVPSLSMVSVANVSLALNAATPAHVDPKLYGVNGNDTLIYAWVGPEGSKDMVPRLLNARAGVVVVVTDGTRVAFSKEHGGRKGLLCETGEPGMGLHDMALKAIREEFSAILADTLHMLEDSGSLMFTVLGGGVMNKVNGFGMCDTYTVVKVKVPLDSFRLDGTDIGPGREIEEAGLLEPDSTEWHPRFRPILEAFNHEGLPVRSKAVPGGAIKDFWLV